jgi:PleD family two-component response regulator
MMTRISCLRASAARLETADAALYRAKRQGRNRVYG